MGVWEGRLVVFESLVNQQIHPLSLSLCPPPFFLPSPLLLNNMGPTSSDEQQRRNRRKKQTKYTEHNGIIREIFLHVMMKLLLCSSVGH